jgi:hypothetical protein
MNLSLIQVCKNALYGRYFLSSLRKVLILGEIGKLVEFNLLENLKLILEKYWLHEIQFVLLVYVSSCFLTRHTIRSES